MSNKFPEHKNLNLSQINLDILAKWEKDNTFEKSLNTRNDHTPFVFYEGPPSANGLPGIHHVMARSIKDIFCRFKTMKGFYVERKAGWDTHGLPVELGVEDLLKITKEDIGKKISIQDYNEACRKEVMRYTDKWEEVTNKMGYWVDMKNPYITYDNRYIETVWWILKQFFSKNLLYKGLSIQPYSPAAGTGLSSHELGMPGCYRDVKDTTCIAQFKAIRNQKSEFLFQNTDTELFFLAWTTTPWTLLSNTALALGKDIQYVKIKTFNPYTSKAITVILAKKLCNNLFPEENQHLLLDEYKPGDKKIPYSILNEYKGSELAGCLYEQLLPYQQPTDGDAFRVITGDFVSTEDGTGIVHIAPSFGADDFKVAKLNGIGSLTLVDKQGKFVEGTGEFANRFVKLEYEPLTSSVKESVDVDIVVKLKKENKCFKTEKYEHTYPHCWRTDKPILYYPLDSWFIKTTEYKQQMIDLNKTINWKPEATGTGRFGQWLENMVDWNLSRSRYWGIPLPVWVSEDRKEIICIGSVDELKKEIAKSVKARFMENNPLDKFVEGNNSKENYDIFDLHKPFVDQIILVSPNGKKMNREQDLIDVWFDSGAMPYAQLHYPFENKEIFAKSFPADFIAEGVDQTRGWFYTLHAISVMLFNSVAFKTVVSNGLVLAKNGVKMSKRLKNAVDPFQTIETYGSDPLRWYMVTNAAPWDNLNFDIEGVEEAKRKFFGTLYNTYSFFALYANVDGFKYEENEIPFENRPEIDRWILSLLNSLIKDVEGYYNDFEPTKAGRAIQQFVTDNLSNWYVRLNRKRFWGGKYNEDKIAAYQTLYTCLETVSRLIAPIAPFYSDMLYTDLNNLTRLQNAESVHLAFFPTHEEQFINKELEQQMELAQIISSMVLSLRRKVNIKVRQPLSKIIIPITDNSLKEKVEAIKSIVLSEVNIKQIELITDTTGILVKKIKADFKQLGKKYGKLMKEVAASINQFSQAEIQKIETDGKYDITINNEVFSILLSEVEIISEDIPGWQVASNGKITVALDITVTNDLREEGIARELVNRIQNLRKDSGFDVTDKIVLEIAKHELINVAVTHFAEYIKIQTLATSINLTDKINENTDGTKFVDLDDEISTYIKISKE